MAVATALVPLVPFTENAAPHEVRLVRKLSLNAYDDAPERLIGDKAYDSDPLDKELREQAVELIAPHKSNRKKARTQDGRCLRRYKRRWKSSGCLRGCKTFVDSGALRVP